MTRPYIYDDRSSYRHRKSDITVEKIIAVEGNVAFVKLANNTTTLIGIESLECVTDQDYLFYLVSDNFTDMVNEFKNKDSK